MQGRFRILSILLDSQRLSYHTIYQHVLFSVFLLAYLPLRIRVSAHATIPFQCTNSREEPEHIMCARQIQENILIRRPGGGASWRAVLVAMFVLGMCCGTADAQEPSWRPVEGQMMTRWAKEVSPETVLPEYPRPTMVRDRWLNLNGLWEFAMRPVDEKQRPEEFDDQILVPFCVESALSGVKKTVVETDRLWYRRQSYVGAARTDGGHGGGWDDAGRGNCRCNS